MKIIFLLFLIIPAISFGQSKKKTDSLILVIAKAKSPQLRAANYIQLASLLENSDLNATKEYLDSAKRFSSLLHDSTLMILNKIYGDYFNDIGQPDTTLKYVKNTIRIAGKLKNNNIMASAFNVKGNALMAKRDFKNAQLAYLEALRLYTLLNNEHAIGSVYVNLGYLFQQQRLVSEAEKQYHQAAMIFNKLVDKERLAQLFNNYGILYGENNLLSKSESYFTKSMLIREKLPDQLALANSYLNVGGISVMLKKYNKGEEFLLKSKALFEQIHNSQGIAGCLTNLGDLQEQLKNYQKAIAYYKESIALSKTNKNMEDLENALGGIGNLYKKLGDYKSAYVYQDELIHLKDTLYQKSAIKQIAEMQTKFETEKKEQQINLLSKENIIQKLSLADRNKTISIIIILFITCVAIGFTVYIRFRSKQQAKLQTAVIQQQDIASKRIIEAEEAERKRIAGDLHDGIGQLFSTVKMNLETLIDRYIITAPDAAALAEKTMAMVDESCVEVRSIAHQMMPNALIKSGLVSAVRDFINKIPSDRIKISVETKGINERMEGSIETVLYRVIQESVNNVIKHANATMLDILLLCDDKEITVTIEDNGNGFDSNNISQFTGIGLKNMTSRVEYLKGTVEVSSSPGKGTLVAIYVPLA